MALRVFSTLAVAGALRALGDGLERAAGGPVSVDYSPTVGLLARIRGGERAEVAILTREGMEALQAEGVLAPGVDLVRSHVGIAVKAGAPRPDIGTEAALRAALLAAPSLAWSRTGASGIAFEALIGRLGIAEPLRAKARIIEAGFTAELAARGDVALAVQQVSELLAVEGIELAGRLPEGLGPVAVFSAAPFAGSERAAAPLLRFLASAEAAPVLRASGLEPIAAA